jgi:hypothetical protein
LDLYQLRWLEHQMLMNRFAVQACFVHPAPDGASLEAEGSFDGREGAAMPHQGEDAGDLLFLGVAAKKWRAFPGAEAVSTEAALVALLFLAQDTDVAFSRLPPCHTVGIGAECLVRVHRLSSRRDCSRRFYAARTLF